MTHVFIPMMIEFQKYERKLKPHDGFLRAGLGKDVLIGCPILLVAQKAIKKFQFPANF